MRTLATILAVLLFSVSAYAQNTIINEWTTETPTYTIKGDGINYNDGTWKKSDPTIVDNGTTYDNTTAPMSWSLNKSEKTIYFTRGDKTLGLKPVGIYYVDKADWDWSVVEALGTPTLVYEDATNLLATDVFLNVDMLIHSTISGPVVNFRFNTKAGYPSAASLGMAPGSTWVCIVQEIVGADLPVIKGDGVTWSGIGHIDASAVEFVASKNWDIIATTATSSDTPDPPENTHITNVRNFLMDKGGKLYLVEAIKYEWFLGKTFPVVID